MLTKLENKIHILWAIGTSIFSNESIYILQYLSLQGKKRKTIAGISAFMYSLLSLLLSMYLTILLLISHSYNERKQVRGFIRIRYVYLTLFMKIL